MPPKHLVAVVKRESSLRHVHVCVIMRCRKGRKSIPPAMKPIDYGALKPVIRRNVLTCCGRILFALKRSESTGLVR